MKNKETKQWIPLYVDKWIFGSTRLELEPGERGVFIDLLCLAAKDNGYIRANEEIGYLPKQLAGLLNISENLLLETVNKCIKSNKLEDKGNNIYYIKSWEEYQFSNRTFRRLNDKETEEVIDENKFKGKIINILSKYKVSVEVEKVCNSGKIDIFVNNKKPVIIEVKNNYYSDSIRGGIRKLLEHGIEYKNSILFLALPIYHKNEISGNTIDKLQEHNINILTLTNIEGELDKIFRQTDKTFRQTDTTVQYNTIEDSIEYSNTTAQNDCKNNPSVPNNQESKSKIKKTKIFEKKNILYGKECDDIVFEIELKDGIAKLGKSIIDKFNDTYNGIDVIGEIKKAITWMDANPDRRKTTKGILRYLNGWLARTNDRLKTQNNVAIKPNNTLSNEKTNAWLNDYINQNGVK